MGCKELRATTRGKKEGEKKEEGKIYVLELHRVVCVFAFFILNYDISLSMLLNCLLI